MPSYATLLVAAFAAVSPALGHFMISVPAPIAGTAIKDPLDPSGDNFPCHGVDISSYSGARTSMAVGSTQPIQFNLGDGANTAVHGGGSCQISLTYETDPAALKLASSWKVIHSFVGGCPTDAPGNLIFSKMCTTNGGSDCVNNFDFDVPSEVKSGDAILAWTWFNTIGNREMYMNCAAVTITGGDDKLDSLPDLFVVNMASVNTCATVENFNVQFPNPGNYVTLNANASAASPYKVAVPPTCGDAVSPSASLSSSAYASSTSAASSAYASSTSAASYGSVSSTSATSSVTPDSYGSVPTNTGGQFVQYTSTPSSTTFSTQTVSSTIMTIATASGTASAYGSPVVSSTSSAVAVPTQSSSSQCLSGHVTCGSDGFYCISEFVFGICDNGCAFPQAVSLGTKCTQSEIGYARRSVAFPPQARRALKLW